MEESNTGDVMLASHGGERKDAPATMGRRIASRRVALGIAAGDLADSIGLSRERLSIIENDRAGDIRSGTLMRIAAALGVSETWLLHGDPRPADAA